MKHIWSVSGDWVFIQFVDLNTAEARQLLNLIGLLNQESLLQSICVVRVHWTKTSESSVCKPLDPTLMCCCADLLLCCCSSLQYCYVPCYMPTSFASVKDWCMIINHIVIIITIKSL